MRILRDPLEDLTGPSTFDMNRVIFDLQKTLSHTHTPTPPHPNQPYPLQLYQNAPHATSRCYADRETAVMTGVGWVAPLVRGRSGASGGACR